MAKREHKILTEFIQLYKEQTCLWNVDSDEYRDKKQRIQAWKLLASKLRQLEPNATVLTAKKKVECLQTGYRREKNRIELSNKRRPVRNVTTLWYYDLLRFIDAKEEQCSGGADRVNCDEETPEIDSPNMKASTRFPAKFATKPEGKLEYHETENLLLPHKDIIHNPFGVYVGEQLTQVATLQRHLTERLISEILFLGKTRKLNIDSKIDTAKEMLSTHSNNSRSRSPSSHFIS